MVLKLKIIAFSLFLSFLLIVFYSNSASSEKKDCSNNQCFNIFSSQPVEGHQPFCFDEKTIYYPDVARNASIMLSCPEGCSENRCNLEFDENGNGRYEEEELLKLIERYSVSPAGKIRIASALNYWKEQEPAGL